MPKTKKTTRRDEHGYLLCSYTIQGKLCFGFAEPRGVCVEHSSPSLHKWHNANRLVSQHGYDYWHPAIGQGEWPERPTCNQRLKTGKMCSRRIHVGFDDGYCYMHGAGTQKQAKRKTA